MIGRLRRKWNLRWLVRMEAGSVDPASNNSASLNLALVFSYLV